MTFKKNVIICVALCIMAILGIALCGCEDLGEYEDTAEYYDAFGDVVMIDGASKQIEYYSVEEYFYNEESREDFLVDDDGTYNGIAHGKYVYVAIPFEKEIEMDSFALFMQSQESVAVYINFYVVDMLPLNWRPIGDNVIGGGQTSDNQTNGAQTGGGTSGDGTGDNAANEKPDYDDPAPEGRVGEIVVYLEKEEWNSFVLEYFTVDGEQRESIQIKEDQYLLLQIRNNSGVRIFDNEKEAFVDPQTGLELKEANITATNLLIRALDVKDGNEEQGGE